MQTNTDVTIYNRYVVAGVEMYQRTQVCRVAWTDQKAANVIRSGSLAADQASIFIPFARGQDYLDPKAWQTLVTKTGKWTLQIGDYIAKGLITDEIHDAVTGPPAAPAFTITSLKNKYDFVLEITSVDRMSQGSAVMHHWQLGAS